jgi:hypothetical protein
MAEKPSTIFINPKFKNAHINPNFLQANNKIHINPKFLLAQQQQNAAIQSTAVMTIPVDPPPLPPPQLPQFIPPPPPSNSAIIKNTRRTLIRVPVAPSRSNLPLQPAIPTFSERKQLNHQQPSQQLIKISKTKLVTAAHLMKCQQKENEIIKQTTESIINSKKLHRKTELKDSIYKLDRRHDPQLKKKKRIVSTYSIRRVDAISPKKVVVSNRKLMKL